MKLFGTMIVIALILLCSDLGAQDKPAQTGDKPAAQKPGEPLKAKDLPVTAEREAAVMGFVERNHAELKELLAHLRSNRPKDYERAIRELYRDSERIGQMKGRDDKQYELELKAWTVRSRIQLLTAHLSMGDNEEIRTQLRGLIGERIDVQTELLRHERERVQERLAKMEQELARMEKDREKIIENQLQVLTKSAADSKSKVKVTRKDGPKPASKKPDKPTVNQPSEKTTTPK